MGIKNLCAKMKSLVGITVDACEMNDVDKAVTTIGSGLALSGAIAYSVIPTSATVNGVVVTVATPIVVKAAIVGGVGMAVVGIGMGFMRGYRAGVAHVKRQDQLKKEMA